MRGGSYKTELKEARELLEHAIELVDDSRFEQRNAHEREVFLKRALAFVQRTAQDQNK